jgi:hypothetical protein
MKINDALGFLDFTKSESDLFERIINKVSLSGRKDQFLLTLNECLKYAPNNSVNKIHNSLYKNSAEIIGERTIWDSSLNELEKDPNWIRTIFLKLLSEDELTSVSQINLRKDSLIACLGSCFATNISKHFKSLGFENSFTLRVEEAVNSPALVRMYLNPSMVGDKVRPVWDSRFGTESKSILELIPRLDLLILTFGVGYDLVDSSDNLVLDPTNVSEKVKNKLYRFKSPTITEQSDHICACINAIRSLNKNIPIFVTLSPVPLSGFVGDIHVIRANTVSKANLSLSIKVAQSRSNFIYIPSYEVVNSIAPIIFNNYIWGEDGTSRHPNNELIKSICEAFIDIINIKIT